MRSWTSRASLPATSSDLFDPIRRLAGQVGVSMSAMLFALALAESCEKLIAVLNEARQAQVQVTPRSEYAPLLTHQTSSSWAATASASVAATEVIPDTAEWQSSSVTGSASDVEAGPTPRWLRSRTATAEQSYWLKRYASVRDGLRQAKLSGIQLGAVAMLLFLLLSPLRSTRSLSINDPSIAVACISSVPPSEDRQSAQEALLHASRVLSSRGAQLIVWPEGALHVLDSRAEDELWRAAQSVVNNHGSAVLLSYRLDGPESSTTQRSTLLARDATPFVHDKTHLVPFFETSSPSLHPASSTSLHLGSTSVSLAIRICHEMAFPSSPAQVLLIPASTSSALLSVLLVAQAREAVLEGQAAGALICDASPAAFSGVVDASGFVSLRQNDALTMHRITLPRGDDTRHLYARLAARLSSTGADLAILGAAMALLLAARHVRKCKAQLERFAQECFTHWLAMSGGF
ncbi:hypothetical protein FA09DRAFT_209565 [Tilletiopsis washingtonensis]|jgi:predicted amidohydrolase|uniref:CN hydrolase domain-containing protein n=1 Tax=Tilletiopsis washingtonensis TaxID=58919 RepID=A0A316ZEM9_9BASI|nr:hypothetical protein FA09DRAFT_209565 [Tilletiopsis washingtonensis]PWO00201.1 hypothetical protein FA09DRAFT_209565 [Tilletiopsis washingtonensis]